MKDDDVTAIERATRLVGSGSRRRDSTVFFLSNRSIQYNMRAVQLSDIAEDGSIICFFSFFFLIDPMYWY